MQNSGQRWPAVVGWLGLAIPAFVFAQDDYRERYGDAEMNISCATAAHSPFRRGLLQLHSFAWEQARASFLEAADADPDCAMAYWGVAMSYYDGLHEPPGDDEVVAAREALDKAGSAANATPREVAWVAAAREIFRGYPEVPRVERDRNYSLAMQDIASRYPDDDEATIVYALSLLSLARRGEDEALLAQAAGLLEPLFDRLPDHPGVAHYLIHACDDSGNREPCIDAARRYAGIAPLMTHAQHMPSHIFAGLGMWEDSNASNEAALEADPRYYHSLMYLVYGDLQLGRWELARRRVAELQDFADSPQGGSREGRGLHSVNTWLLLETRDWEAAADAPMYSDAALDVAETLYVRGLGAARTGRLDEAGDALRSIRDLLGKLDAVNDTGLAVRGQLIRIQAAQVEASIAFAEERYDDAVAIMTAATAIEDGPGVERAPPDSGTGLPAHEVLGEMLLELGRHDEARQHFSKALERTPNRLHSLLGLARAAAAGGDTAGAAEAYAGIVELLSGADAGIAAIAEARAYLAQHGEAAGSDQ